MKLIGSNPGSPSLLRRLLGGVLRLDEEDRRCHQAILDLLGRIAPKETLLDVGCWDGLSSMEYARVLGCPKDGVSGIECDPEQLEQAKKRLKVYQADIDREAIPLPDGGFDVVVCNQVLEHTKNIFLLMGECERVTRVGGYIVFGIPNLAGLLNRASLALGRQPSAIGFPSPHVRGITHKAFVAFIRINPAMELVATIGSTLYPLPYPLMEWAGRRFPEFSAYTFYLLKKRSHAERSCWKEAGAKITQTLYIH